MLPVGGQDWIHQVPACPGSEKKKWRWNPQPTCGSFWMIGSVSPAPSWILTVPLLPGGAANVGPAMPRMKMMAVMRPSAVDQGRLVRRAEDMNPPFVLG